MSYGSAYDNWVATTQSTSNAWQYHYTSADRTTSTLLPDYQLGNDVVANEYQWDNNQNYLSNYPHVQRITTPNTNAPAGELRTAMGGTPNLVLHPADKTPNQYVALVWKNTTGAAVTISGTVTFKLGFPTSNFDGSTYFVQRELVGATNYSLLTNGTLAPGTTGTTTYNYSNVTLQNNERLYVIIGNVEFYNYDHVITTLTVNKVINIAETPATASALMVDPVITAETNITTAADPMIVSNAEFVDPTFNTQSQINIIETPATATALMRNGSFKTTNTTFDDKIDSLNPIFNFRLDDGANASFTTDVVGSGLELTRYGTNYTSGVSAKNNKGTLFTNRDTYYSSYYTTPSGTFATQQTLLVLFKGARTAIPNGLNLATTGGTDVGLLGIGLSLICSPATGRVSAQIRSSSGGFAQATSTTDVTDQKWHLLVGIKDGSNLKIYVDGKLEGTTTTGFNLREYGVMSVGMSPAIPGSVVTAAPRNVTIDEVAVFPTALSNQDIFELWRLLSIDLGATATALAVDPIESVEESNAADPMVISNAVMVDPVITTTIGAIINETPATASAEFGSRLYFGQVQQDEDYQINVRQVTAIDNTGNIPTYSVDGTMSSGVWTRGKIVAIKEVTGIPPINTIAKARLRVTNPFYTSNSNIGSPRFNVYVFTSNPKNGKTFDNMLLADLPDTELIYTTRAVDEAASTGNGDVDITPALTDSRAETYGIMIDLYEYDNTGTILPNNYYKWDWAANNAGNFNNDWIYLLTTIINVNVNETPATASALFVDPVITAQINISVPADPMTASALFVDSTVTTTSNVDFPADFMFVSLATMPDSVITTTSNVSLAWLPATVNAEFVDPAISTEFNLTVLADPMTANAEMTAAQVILDEEISATPMEANAEFVEPVYFVEEVNIASPMEASATIVDATFTTNANIDFAAAPMLITLATMETPTTNTTSTVSVGAISMEASAEFVDPTVLAIQNVSFIAVPMTASALFVNPAISVVSNVNILATPLQVSNAELLDPATSINEIIIVTDSMDANARVAVFTGQGAAVGVAGRWDGWDDDLTNFNKNADGWHGYGITNSDGAPIAPFSIGDDPLQGEIPPIAIAATWSTSAYGTAFAGLNGLRVFRNVESTFGPDDDGIYALKGIESLEDVYFTGPNLTGTASANIVNFKTNVSGLLPSCVGYTNIGESSYAAASNLIKQFSYEFLFKTTDTNAILASGGVVDKSNFNVYWSEFKIENGYPVFEYTVTNSSGIKLKEFKFTGSNLVNTGSWTHLLVQTNKNDGLYQNLESLTTTGDKYWTDPVSLGSESYNTIDIYVNGGLSCKAELDYAELYDDTTNVSIGNIYTIGRSLNRMFTDNIITSATWCESSTANRFTGTWAGMVKRSTDVYASQFVGNNVSQTFVNGVTALNPADTSIMANLALRNRMRFVEENDGATALMVNPTISVNTKKLLRLYFFGENATNEMFGVNSNLHNVVTYSVINNVSTDKDKLFNADKAYLSGAANPETDSAEVIVDAWRNPQNYKKFINLQSDVAEYNDIDGIIFMDYPDNGVEWSNLMPGYSDQWVSDQYDQFLASLRQAINAGKGLFVSSSRLAEDLKIISGVQEITQDVQSPVTFSDPFGDSSGDTFYDTSRNNKYKIVGQEQDLTTVSSFIMTDFISHTADLTDDYHVKYANRPNGLQVGDQFIIPSLPLIKSQLLTDLVGDTSNRIGENTLEVFAYTDILAGRPIAELGTTGYVTTIILEPGDVLDGEVIGGKIIVNCVEDGLTMGLDEYNYGYRQVVSVNTPAENSDTILWDYSTSRTLRQLEPLSISPETKGQTFPTEGGGGPIIQAPTHSSAANIRTKFDKANKTFTSGIYYDVNGEKYDLDRIPVYSMTYRGINWLLQPSDRQGTFVGEEAATAQAVLVQPTTTAQIVVPLPPKNVTVSATPMTANAVLVTNISALYGNANTIILTLHHQDVITLYIEKERL